MPRPSLPPTPVSSTDLLGKDNAPNTNSSLEMSFTLPPPALTSASNSRNRSSNDSEKSESPYHPRSATSSSNKLPFKSCIGSGSRRYQESPSRLGDFSLPPPPTRSRKIIQMKPGMTVETKPILPNTSAPSRASSKVFDSAVGFTSTGKRKASSTSVAGRKVARKTAHSLIERRRRSKMNEEFGVLKDMIPACRDQEMHKLAILQASIDYLRYLEQCISNLKVNNVNIPITQVPTPSRAAHPDEDGSRDEDDEEDKEDEDDDLEMMEESSTRDHSITYSPALITQEALESSIQSTGTIHNKSHESEFEFQSQSQWNNPTRQPRSISHSQTASPTLRPSYSNHSHSIPSDTPRNTTTSSTPTPRPRNARNLTSSTEISPALLPNHDQMIDVFQSKDSDQEASAALLMLNTDRRSKATSTMSVAHTSVSAGNRSGRGSASGRGSGRGSASGSGSLGKGMSVRDLLST
ncbi:hypothetical protein MMC09_003502 [Bachmanniomyces sp. S44760]|nr:hypothetical protein [Bachmanniomyces sp. S44760]